MGTQSTWGGKRAAFSFKSNSTARQPKPPLRRAYSASSLQPFSRRPCASSLRNPLACSPAQQHGHLHQRQPSEVTPEVIHRYSTYSSLKLARTLTPTNLSTSGRLQNDAQRLDVTTPTGRTSPPPSEIWLLSDSPSQAPADGSRP